MDFALKFATGSDTVIAGLSDPNTLTASGIAGFNAPVTFTCTTDAPAASCTLASGTVALSGDVPDKTSVTTLAPYTLVGYGSATPWSALVGMLSMAGFFALRRRFPGLARAGLLCGGLWFVSAALSGCSGKLPSRNSVYTPAGTYTVTVTGSDGFLTHTVTYQLAVKEN